MKHLVIALLAASFAASPLSADLEDDLPLGIEAVTGIRSDYVYRGFNLADVVMDFQLETEVVLDDTLALGAGAWFASEVSDNFTEGGAFLDLSYSLHKDITVGGSASYHAYGHSFLEDGFDLGLFLTWHADRNWNMEARVHRDLATNGWYAHLGSDWSIPLSDKTYLRISAGISAVENYYGRSGLNDFHGQASLTHNINTMLSITPFAGWSCELDSGDGSEFYGGLWFEVSF